MSSKVIAVHNQKDSELIKQVMTKGHVKKMISILEEKYLICVSEEGHIEIVSTDSDEVIADYQIKSQRPIKDICAMQGSQTDFAIVIDAHEIKD